MDLPMKKSKQLNRNNMKNFTEKNFKDLFDKTFISDTERATKDVQCGKCKARSKNNFDGMARPIHFYPLVCAIDYLRYFKYGGNCDGKQYKQIVNQYISNYEADFLYNSFRCGLVHQLQIKSNKFYIFTDDVNDKINTRNYHLKEIEITTDEQGEFHATIFNLKIFIDDIKNASEKLFSEIFQNKTTDPEPYNRCANWYRGFILSKKRFNKNNLDIQFFSI
jgi:hypothetical protein